MIGAGLWGLPTISRFFEVLYPQKSPQWERSTLRISKNFVDPQRFNALLREVSTAEGGKYQDPKTVYGDMSRLVVAWIANTDADELDRVYNLAFKGPANIRPVQECAKLWMEKFRPEVQDPTDKT